MVKIKLGVDSQQPVKVQKPPTTQIHGHGRGRGAAQHQVKTPYIPPPVKKPQQQAPLRFKVKLTYLTKSVSIATGFV